MGWKTVGRNTTSNMFHLVDHCKKIGFTDLEACAKNDSFGLSDFLNEAKIGALEPKSLLLNSSLWTEDLTATPYGRHFTLKIPGIIRRNHSNFVLFHVDTKSDFYYSIWVHDEKFFLININPFRNNAGENTWFCPHQFLSVPPPTNFYLFQPSHFLDKSNCPGLLNSPAL